MTVAMLRDEPYATEHSASVARGMEQGKMPKSLSGLVRWFVANLGNELPDRLHTTAVWHDRVSPAERESGVQPVGGSLIGSHDYAGIFRLIVESEGASVTDDDGYYLFPIRRALAQMRHRRPLMARFLVRLGMCEGDWRAVATALGYPDEFIEVYTQAALVTLWKLTFDRTTA